MLSSFSFPWAENEDMPDGLPTLTADAPGAIEARDPTLKKEVSQPNLASPRLDEDGALGLMESLMELEDVLVWRHLSCCRGSCCSILLRLLPSLKPVSLLSLMC